MGPRALWTQEEELVVERPRPRARFLTDRNGVMCDLNLDACVMLDYARRFLLGRRLAVLVVRDDVPKLERLLLAIGSKTSPTSLRLRNRVGALHPVAISAALATDGKQVRWTAQPDFARMARA